MKSLKNLGEATVFIYPQKDMYIGVCLELDLIDEDRDRDVLAKRMKQHVQSYISYIQKKNFDASFVRKPAPKKYWNKFYQFLGSIREEQKQHARSVAPSVRRTSIPSLGDFVVSRQSLACEPA